MGNHWTGRAKILEAQTLVPCKAQRRRPHGRSMGCALGNQSSGVLIPVGKLLLHATTTVYGSVDFSLPVGDFKIFKCVFFFFISSFFPSPQSPPILGERDVSRDKAPINLRTELRGDRTTPSERAGSEAGSANKMAASEIIRNRYCRWRLHTHLMPIILRKLGELS